MSGVTVEVHWDVEGPYPLSDERVVDVARAALEHGDRPSLALSVAFVDDSALAALHGRFLGDDSPTDVMSFDLGEDTPGPGGELYVSVDRARSCATARGVPVERELALYVVHGVLHLCGFDDHEPAERGAMRAAEQAVMDVLGFPPDDAPHELGA
jgi:probable rRNA maturation factor